MITDTKENMQNVYDVTTQTFNELVVEASHNHPIIIQFWANWCEPCKQLAPNLESVVLSKNGAVKLARLDIESNKELAQQMQVKSVPTVACVYKGRPVDGFTGNTPKEDLEIFVKSILEKCPIVETETTPDITQLMEQSELAIKACDYVTAMPLYMEMLELVPNNPVATAGLAICYINIGEIEAGKEILEASEYQDNDAIINAKKVLNITLENASSDEELVIFKNLYDINPSDMQNGLSYTQALFVSARQQQAIDILLELFAQDKEWNDKAIKKELLKYFDVLGSDNPITIAGRKKLSSLLFI